MTAEPDIVRVLREEEKDGKLRSDFSIRTDNQIKFEKLDSDKLKNDNKKFSDSQKKNRDERREII